MKKKINLAKISPFMVDPEPIEKAFGLNEEDFAPASDEEKESIVEKHKSVSYWRDAWRRFRKNKVSMVALFVFIIILLFAFVGPALIPYNYKEQYRQSPSLSPMEYSDDEKEIMELSKNMDGVYATSMAEGGKLKKGNYYFVYDGKTYGFYLSKLIVRKTHGTILFSKDAEHPLVLRERDERSGEWLEDVPLELTDTPAEGATELKMMDDIFPHVFGTDDYGRDMMARTMIGARVSIIIGITAALIVLIIGSIYGSISGLIGGKVDFVMMRIVELIYSIPDILIVLLLQVILVPKDQNETNGLKQWLESLRDGPFGFLSQMGVGIFSIFITFALLYWVTMARIVRGQVLQLKKQEYVNAAVALGAGKWRIIRRHLLPNAVGTLVITTCLQIPAAIFLEAFLSYLGMGVSTDLPTLGSLCSEVQSNFLDRPHLLIFPAGMLTLIVLSLNLVGDGLRDALDPRLKS